ncbi:GD18229 [Drosophila simulans]|uniref:GD18229 n=1 Tax=Drosophila simulans TaxID=7240 RepID=B4QUC6_DROSI|nr:GD18229 [Drosophila simulans]
MQSGYNFSKVPNRLISPETLLRRRKGNSYEMATLLASMLIGAGHPALVVSGVAREETILNDQLAVSYPYPIVEVEAEEVKPKVEKPGQKYKLRGLPDLKSHLEEDMAEVHRQKEAEEKRIQDEIIRKQMEDLELLAVDRYHYRRSHAWVVIINNAPWSVKPKTTYTDVNGDVVEAPPTAIFIEPSTGFICETGCKQYILVDSIWNEYNYYVCKQKHQRVSELRWDLRDTKDWEHMLPGEPPEMRTYKMASDENVADEERDISEEKHLDCIGSWVERLHIGLADFEQRFPSSEKKIQYRGAIHERFSPYSQRDGKVMQLTIFHNDECTIPKVRYEYYENRSDLMRHVKYTYATDQFEEIFNKGRNDSLKSIEYFSDPSQQRKVHFYSASRIDSLELMVVEPGSLVLHYKDRSDKCWYKEFEFTPAGNVLKANPLDPTRTNLELYRLLCEQLQYEDHLRKNFEKIFEDINNVFDLRKSEKAEPKLKFSIFDPLRNGAARAIRMRQFEEEEELKKEIASKPADFLAPYLVPYKHQEELTPEQSQNAYNACLNDLKSRFVSLLNNLQRHYEDLTSESKSLNRFLNKFENQFNNYDYKRLVQQSKDLELNKRMVQQRLTLTHEESQKKYEVVKNSLLKDPRLNFKKDDAAGRASETSK